MNKTYYETLDENFVNALKLFETEYSHNELIEFLKVGNIPQKQIAALKLEGIYSQGDAQALMNNLTGQDGKIREAVSIRLKEFMSNDEFLKYFKGDKYCDIFLDAIIDINGNICRNIISAVINLREDNLFCSTFCSRLCVLALQLLDVVEKFDFRDGKYKVNKEAFKLYWCLEAIYEFWDKVDIGYLKKIIMRSKDIQEYTIREKTAKILSREFKDKDLTSARSELKNDKNYYVRRF